MTEKELMQGLIDAAGHAGWLCYHTHDSRRSEPGFPDLVLVHKERLRVAFIECKAEKGRVTAAQKAWLDALEIVLGDERFEQRVATGIANPDTYDSWLAYIMGSKV